MSNRKAPGRLLTIPEFIAAHPEYTENNLRWALRARERNGLKPYVYKRAFGVMLYLDEQPVLAWLTRTVQA
jgi:hypothetical protein